MKKLTFPLHPGPICGQYHKKQKRCRSTYQSLFELQNMFFIFWSDPLNLKTVEMKGKTGKILNISRMKRAF